MYLVSGTGGSKLTAPVLRHHSQKTTKTPQSPPSFERESSDAVVKREGPGGMPLTTSIKNQMLRLLRRTKSTRERPASSSIVFSNKRCLTSVDNVLLESSPKPIRPTKSVRQSESMALGTTPAAPAATTPKTPSAADSKKSVVQATPHSRTTYSREWHHRARRQSKQVS